MSNSLGLHQVHDSIPKGFKLMAWRGENNVLIHGITPPGDGPVERITCYYAMSRLLKAPSHFERHRRACSGDKYGLHLS